LTVSLDATELAALRMAAALAHVVAGVRLQVRHGPTPLLEVGPPPFDADPTIVRLCPHAFRAAVCQATTLTRRGHEVAMRGVPDDAALAVDVTLPPGGRILPGPVYDLPAAEGRWILVVTTAPAELVAKTAGSVVDAFDDTTADARVVTRHVAACDADDAVDQCQQLLSQLGVLELEAWLAEVS
jgi:hypothetical protein